MSHPALDSFGDLDHAARDPHVAACAQCQAQLAAQQQVRDLLASLPDPGPTPPDVVDRIEATLRRLSADEAVPAAAATHGAGSTVVPLRPPVERRRHRPLVAVAAAAALVVAGGVGVSQLVPRSGGDTSTAAGAALRESPRKEVAPAGQLQAVASGTSYTKARLPQQVRQVMGTARADRGAVTGPLATASGVAQCLAALGAPQATPLLVDVARFEGKPAAVLVLPAAGGGQEIWVVATTCAPNADGTQYFTRVR